MLALFSLRSVTSGLRAPIFEHKTAMPPVPLFKSSVSPDRDSDQPTSSTGRRSIPLVHLSGVKSGLNFQSMQRFTVKSSRKKFCLRKSKQIYQHNPDMCPIYCSKVNHCELPQNLLSNSNSRNARRHKVSRFYL